MDLTPAQGQSNKPGGDSHWLKNDLASLPAISENSSDAKIVFKPKRFEIFLPVITFSEKRGKHRRQERAWGASVRLLTGPYSGPKEPWLQDAVRLDYHFLISSVIQLSFLVSACYILKFMKTFIKPVCSKQKSTAISKLGFHMYRQAELTLEHVHSDLRAAPRKQYMALAVRMYQSPTPLARPSDMGPREEFRLKAQGCRAVCGLPGSGAGSPHTRPAACLTRPQCTGARHQVGLMPQ